MTLYEQTIASIDGMAAIKAARLAIVRAQTALRSADFTPDDAARPAAALVASLVAGDGIPDDLGAQVLDVRRQREEHAARHRVLTLAAEQLAQHERGTVYNAAAGLIVGLRTAFAEILGRAREATADLGSARTADAAIAAGMKNAGAWSRLVAVTAEYDAMRSAHFRLLLDSNSDQRDVSIGNRVLPVRTVVDDCGFWDNADEVWPDRWDGRPARMVTSTPWPSDRRAGAAGVLTTATVDQAVPPPDAAFVAWLVTSVARPWLPTLAELVAARVELGQLHNEREEVWKREDLASSPTKLAEHRERIRKAQGRRAHFEGYQAERMVQVGGVDV